MWSSSTRASKYELAFINDLALDRNTLLINLTNSGETAVQNVMNLKSSEQQLRYHVTILLFSHCSSNTMPAELSYFNDCKYHPRHIFLQHYLS
jgi:hypothetical protein